MTHQQKRLATRVITAAIFGFIVSSLIAASVGMPFGIALFLGICAATASGLSLSIAWRKLVKSGETRAKGAFYCGVAGLMAAGLTGLFVGLSSGALRMLSGGSMGVGFVEWLLYAILVQPLMAALIGGIFAVPIGAIAGFAMSRNPQSLEPTPTS